MIADRKGFAKPTPRPAMVAALTEINNQDDEVAVVVGTTDVAVIRDDMVLVHSDYQLNPTTKLRRPTAIVCSWTAMIKYGEIQELGGFLKARYALPILKKMIEYKTASD